MIEVQKQKEEDYQAPRINKKLIASIGLGLFLLIIISVTFALSPSQKEEYKPEKNTNVTPPNLKELMRHHQIPENVTATPSPTIFNNTSQESSFNTPEPLEVQTIRDLKKEVSFTKKTNQQHIAPLPGKITPTRPPLNPYIAESYKKAILDEEAARGSGLFISVSFNSGTKSEQSTENTQPQEYPANPFAPYAFNMPQTLSESPETPANNYKAANMQNEKESFFNNNASDKQLLMADAPAAALSNLIHEGTLISAVLNTAINSDLPGEILATVNENVYSADGANILIPQGTRLIARYNSNVSWYQNRLQIAWHRLIRPDGVSMKLGNMPGVDERGNSGYSGDVDNHPWETLSGLATATAFTILGGEIKYQAGSIGSQALVDVTDQVTQDIGSIGAQYTERAMNRQPTINIKGGTRVKVFINTDLVFPHYQH